MVAKARGDLFDVSVGGAGFHFTSHLIALVALFIACFAIAGYISYRTDSIPASAVKDGDGFADEDLTAKSLTLSGDLVYFPSRSTTQTAIADGSVTTSPASWSSDMEQVFNSAYDFSNGHSSVFNIPTPSAADIGKKMIIYFTATTFGAAGATGTAVFNIGNANAVTTNDTTSTIRTGSQVIGLTANAFSSANNNRLTLTSAATNTDVGRNSVVTITVDSATSVFIDVQLNATGAGANALAVGFGTV